MLSLLDEWKHDAAARSDILILKAVWKHELSF